MRCFTSAKTGKLTVLGIVLFILIALAFFFFIFFWRNPATEALPPRQLTEADKMQILNQLSAMASTSARTSHKPPLTEAQKMQILDQLSKMQ